MGIHHETIHLLIQCGIVEGRRESHNSREHRENVPVDGQEGKEGWRSKDKLFDASSEQSESKICHS